jgi:Tfp pilus assembly protein PilO
VTGNRIWILGTVVLSVALLALGWFLGISPRLEEVSTANVQRATVEQQNAATQVTIERLKADYANLDQVAAELDELRRSLPPSADYTAFLRELNAIAGDNDATLTSFVPAAPTVFQPLAADGTTTTAAPADPTTDAAAAAIADGTLIAIPVQLAASGSYADLVRFVGDLQHGDRLYLANTVTISGDEGEFSVALDGNMFVEIDSTVTAPTDVVSEPQPTQTPEPPASATPEPTETEPAETPGPDTTDPPATNEPESPATGSSSSPTP